MGTERMRHHKKAVLSVLVLLSAAAIAGAANLASPISLVPPARLAFGAVYHVGGYPLTDNAVPSIMNRVMATCSFDPFDYADIGVDIGATALDVASFTGSADTIGVFHGDWRFSIGGHLKLASPMFFDNSLGAVCIGQATTFSSRNKNGAEYGGYDGTGAAGITIRVPQFGMVTVGAKLYLIQGENKGYTGATAKYSNIRNMSGWLAVDFIPPVKEETKGKPFFSFEMSATPDAGFSESVPIKDIAFSVSIGWISPRLWGEDLTERAQ